MPTYFTQLIADVGSVLGMLAIIIVIPLLARGRTATPPRPLTWGWIIVLIIAVAALILRAIVLGQLLAS